MRVEVGPYLFSTTDVRRTLANALLLLDSFPAASHGLLSSRRQRMASTIAAVDPANDPLEDLAPVLESVWADLLGARDDLVAGAALPSQTSGRIVNLASSGGGLPKAAVDRVEIDHSGVVGDVQATRLHHGRPFQALCLWSAEVIDDLAGDGHPIGYGSAGENVTVAGVEWSRVHPGVRLLVGSALCEVSTYAVPCSQTAGLFADRDFNRIHHSNGPISRIYATVLEPGAAAVGDRLVLEP